jgi:hypothetical protein
MPRGHVRAHPSGGCPRTFPVESARRADGVVYLYHPSDDPTLGRAAVVASWLGEGDAHGASTRDAPGTYRAHYAPIAVDRDTVVAVGTTHYTEVPGGPVVRTYDNCFVMRFDGDGQCREFTEYYVRRPD